MLKRKRLQRKPKALVKNAEPPRMHRVLAIPELLDIVFAQLDHRHNAANARVCKQWSEIALDRLWRQLDNLYALLRTLGPMSRNQGTLVYRFARPPLPSNWARFESYAKRVRMLKFEFDPSSRDLPAPHPSIFDDIARTRTSLHILPNMKHLHWAAPYQYCVLFLHPGLRILELPTYHSGRRPRSPLHNLTTDIITRAPNLVALRLQAGQPFHPPDETTAFYHHTRPAHFPTPYSITHVRSQVLTLLRNLPRLRHVTLSRFWFTSEVAEVLSALPELTTVDFNYEDEEGCGDPYDILRFAPVFPQSQNEPTEDPNQPQTVPHPRLTGPFPALYDLSLCTPFCHIPDFLTNLGNNAQNITKIHITSPILEAPCRFQEVLETLKEKTPFLEMVALVGLVTVPNSYAHALQAPEPPSAQASSSSLGPQRKNATQPPDLLRRLTFAHLRPLLKLSSLKSVEVIHHVPISFSDEDLEIFVREVGKSGKVEKVVLGGEPCVDTSVWSNLEMEGHRNDVDMDEDDEGGDEEGDEDEDERDNPNEPILSLQHTIRTFAKYCPSVKHLGVFVVERTTRAYEDGEGDGYMPLVDDLLEFSPPLQLEKSNADDATASTKTEIATPLPAESSSQPNQAPSLSNVPIQNATYQARHQKLKIPSPPLSSLHTLSFGPSLIHNPSKVALFLSHYVPEDVNVECGVSWGGDEKNGYYRFLRGKKRAGARAGGAGPGVGGGMTTLVEEWASDEGESVSDAGSVSWSEGMMSPGGGIWEDEMEGEGEFNVIWPMPAQSSQAAGAAQGQPGQLGGQGQWIMLPSSGNPPFPPPPPLQLNLSFNGVDFEELTLGTVNGNGSGSVIDLAVDEEGGNENAHTNAGPSTGAAAPNPLLVSTTMQAQTQQQIQQQASNQAQPQVQAHPAPGQTEAQAQTMSATTATAGASPHGPQLVQGKVPPVIGINGEMDMETMGVIGERCVRWRKVVELLPLLVRMRREERERVWRMMIVGRGVHVSPAMGVPGAASVGNKAVASARARTGANVGNARGEGKAKDKGKVKGKGWRSETRRQGRKGIDDGEKAGRDGCIIC